MREALLLLAFFLALPVPRALGEERTLSLEELYTLAETRADSMRIRDLGVQEARHSLREARSRALPRLTLEASGSLLASPPAGITVRAGELGTFSGHPIPGEDLVFVPDAEHSFFSFGASLTQPLFTWGRITAGLRTASLELSASLAELERQRLDLRQEVHRAYCGALLAHGSLPLLEQMREALGLIAADRRRSAVEGLGTQLPVLEAQAELAGVERRLAESRENLATALQTLLLLCGQEPVLPALGTPFRELAPELDEELLAARADSGSRELEIADLRRGQALERLRLEKGGAALRPDLSLALTLEVSGQEVPGSSAGWTDTWDWDLMLSLGTRVRLYDGGEAESRLGQARAEAEAAGAARQQAGKFLRLRLRQAVQEARLAALEVQERHARLAAAEERWRNAQSAYENQLLTRCELAAAQAARGAATLEQLSAGYRLELALAALERLAAPISPGSGS